jgi:hypothetical protein
MSIGAASKSFGEFRDEGELISKNYFTRDGCVAVGGRGSGQYAYASGNVDGLNAFLAKDCDNFMYICELNVRLGVKSKYEFKYAGDVFVG